MYKWVTILGIAFLVAGCQQKEVEKQPVEKKEVEVKVSTEKEKTKEETKEVATTPSQTQTEQVWNGEWDAKTHEARGGSLVISNQNDNTFDFSLDVFYQPTSDEGATRLGSISGKAFINGEAATFNDAKTNCTLTFSQENGKISVEANDEKCSSFAGESVFFGGDYTLYWGDIWKKQDGTTLAVRHNQSNFSVLEVILGDVEGIANVNGTTADNENYTFEYKENGIVVTAKDGGKKELEGTYQKE